MDFAVNQHTSLKVPLFVINHSPKTNRAGQYEQGDFMSYNLLENEVRKVKGMRLGSVRVK